MNSIIEELSWERPEEVQTNAIKEILNDKDFDYSLLMQPFGKDCWGNCAKILTKLDYEKVISYPELSVWLQDSNWPGSMTIILVRFISCSG